MLTRYQFALIVISFVLVACASEQPLSSSPDAQVTVPELAARAGLVDGRGRFREVFCSVLMDHGEDLPDFRTCDQALTRVDPEPKSDEQPVNLASSQKNHLILIVPGLGWECFENWLGHDNSASKHVAQYGYEVQTLNVDSLSSTANNAKQIRDMVAALPSEKADRPIILLGYSKGAPDILEAVTSYPELARRVTAIVSLAGSIGGSPLADDAEQDHANLLTMVPGAECDEGDEGAVDSLKTAVRRQWLSDNPLPESIRYYSVITYPEPARVSRALKNGYHFLSGIDVRNDTQVLIQDQMIPGSTLVAYVNADHWAIAVPIARTHEIVASLVVDQNDYPREAFLEALLRYVEQDIAPQQHQVRLPLYTAD